MKSGWMKRGSNCKGKTFLLKAVFVFFLLNCFSVYVYFLPLTAPLKEPATRLTAKLRPRFFAGVRRYSSGATLRRRRLKPWPSLPSYLPWKNHRGVPTNSCEAYFGNGFTGRVDLLDGGGGWFGCFYSETLRSSVCEGSRLRIVPKRIRVSVGGERLKEVIGREEDDEMPVFDDGAFELDGGDAAGLGIGGRLVNDDRFLDMYVPQGDVDRHRMRDLLGSIRVVEAGNFHCDEWVEEPTLLVIRYEYANVFHTVTDWYSAYVSSRVAGLPSRPHLVFVDGHCKTQLEETWEAFFSSIRHVESFRGSVCFCLAVLSPLGYETPLFEGLTNGIDCHGASVNELQEDSDERMTSRLHEFGEMIRSAFGFSASEGRKLMPGSDHNVLFVQRENYVAHPRSRGKIESRLSNEQEVFDAVKVWASNHLGCKINLVNGLFAHMPMKEQVRAIRDASVIIGAHGAGLTHIVSALPETVILEIVAEKFRRPHFALIAQWKGLDYHSINLRRSYANPSGVVHKLESIMKRLGC